MSEIRLYLTDGFANDHVIIKVDGRKVFDHDAVTTERLYGLAKELDPITVTGPTAKIQVSLPNKGLNTEFDADLGRGDRIPISVADGHFRYSVEKRLGFM